MDTPLISVILATYNGSQFLEEAILSVLSQDYANLELIIIDDASIDIGVGKIIEKFKQKDSRIISHRNEKNMERSWSKNYGVKQSRGEYITFIDDDDLWEKEKLSKQLAVIQERNDIGIVGTFARFIDEGGHILSETNYLKITPEEIYGNILLSNQFIQSAVLVRKDIFIEAGGFPDFNLCEDYDLWFRILMISKGMNIPEFLVKYRVRTASTTAKNTYRMKQITIELIWKYHHAFPGVMKSLVIRIITFLFDATFLLKIWNQIFKKESQL